MQYKVVAEYSIAKLESVIRYWVGFGFSVQGGISTCVNLSNDVQYSVIMFKQGDE